MAEHHHERHHPADAITRHLPEKTPSTSQILAVVALFPVGGALLAVSAVTLTATLIGLAVSVPLFVIFSPILVPAVLALALAVAGFITSGAFAVTALSSISWLLSYMRRMGAGASLPEQLGRRVRDTAGYVGDKTREAGQKAQDVMRP